MRLSEDIDFTTLTWVKGELDETLKQARHALEAYVEDPQDSSQMRFCATYLHQVHGTLRMVELYGAAMVTEEMERLSTALLEGEVKERDEAYAVLMRGIVQLPDYLERLQSGHKDIPIVLLPLLNELRASRGEKSLSESVLFTPDLSRALPESAKGPDLPMPDLEVRQFAEKQRSQFQLALLNWFKGQDIDANIAKISDVCDQLVAHTNQEEARRLFWVAAGVMEALRAKAFEPSQQLKQTIGKVEREIKRLADAGESSFRVDPPRDLTRNLLYFVAHAPTEHGRIGELREVFRLNALLPSEEELAHAQGVLSGHNRALLDTVSAAIKDDLMRVKDALDLHLRNPDADIATLQPQVEVLDRVGDTLGMLGLGVARRVIQDQHDAVSDMLNGSREATESALLDVAGALLYVEASLDDQVQGMGGEKTAPAGDGRPLPMAEGQKVLDAVVKEAQSNFAQVKQCFVAFVESSWDHAQLTDVPRLLEEVAGAFRIMELDEPPQYLAAVRRFTEIELLGRKRVPNGQQMDTLADVLASLEYFIEALREHRPKRDTVLQTTRDSLESLGYWPIPDLPADLQAAPAEASAPVEAPEPAPVEMPAAPAAAAPQASEPAAPAAPAETKTEAPTPTPAPEPAASTEVPVAPTPAPVSAPAAAAPPPGHGGFEGAADDIDDEIREVFIEEVEEEINNLEELLPAWKKQPENLDLLKPIRRVFHTLKGSGRLVGALTLGEFSWKVENMLNRVLDQTVQPGEPVQALIQHAYNVLPEMLSALRGEGGVSTDLEAIKAVADRLSEGEEAWYTPAAAVAEPAQVAVEAAPVEEAAAEEEAEAAVESAEEAVAEVEEADGGMLSRFGIDPLLFDILKTEVAGHLEGVETFLARCEPAPVPADDSLLRAVHTMNGAFAMTEVPGITDVVSPLEGYIKRLLAQGAAPTAAGLGLMRESVAAVREVMDRLESGSSLPALADLSSRLMAERDTLPEPKGPSIPMHLDDEDEFIEGDGIPEPVDYSVLTAEQPPEEVVEAEAEPAEEIDTSYLPQPIILEAPDTSALPDLDAPAVEEQAVEEAAVDSTEVADEELETELLSIDELVEASDAADETTDLELIESGFEIEEAELATPVEEDASEEAELAVTEAEESEPSQPDDALAALISAYESEPETESAGTHGLTDEVELESAGSDSAEREAAEAAEREAAEAAEREAAEAAERQAAEAAEREAAEAAEREAAEAAEREAAEAAEREAAEAAEREAAEAAEREAAEAAEREAAEAAEREAAEAAEREAAEAAEREAAETAEREAAEAAAQEAARRAAAEAAVAAELAALAAAEQARPAEETVEKHEAPAEAELVVPEDAADPDQPLDVSDLDEELLDIFLEEGGDILDHSDGLLAKLREEPSERENIIALQRDLHTLKGGARMAGLPEIGDLGHAMESLLEAVAEGKRELGRNDVSLLERAFDRLHSMTTRIGDRRALAMPTNMIALIEGMVSGEAVPTVQTPAAQPAVSEEAPATAKAEPAAVSSDGKPPALKPLHEPLPELEDEDQPMARAPQEQIRIRADLLDRLVNYAGEVAIYRARLEQQLGDFRGSLVEMEQTNTRLREQLRRLEIETEAQIIARYQREAEVGESTFDPLELDRFSTLQQLSRALSESAADLVNLQMTLEDQTRLHETLLLQQSRVSSDLQEGLMRTRMVPFDSLVPRLRRIMRQTSGELGKKAQLKVDGAQGEMDRNVLDRMTAPLEHMLRNALAHGMETPQERKKAGKSEEGTVRIALSREASEVVLRVSDDGRGMDRDAIRKKAIERGLLKEDAQLSDRDLYGFVLETGFSTAQTVSKIAGRGVGMDVVNSEIKQLGGSLYIESERGKGTEFVVRLPLTLAVTQAVFVQLSETSFAMPISSVQGVSRIARDELEQQLASDNPVFEYVGEEYQIYDLGLLLGQAHVRAEDSLQVPLLLARSGDLRAAICVDQVIGSREIVVKPTGPQISSIPGVFGATVMGDGRVVVILDVVPLVRHAAALKQSGDAPAPAPVIEQRRVPVVMVVDDSITMRKVTGRILERHNYEVMTAKDGIDAIEKLQERIPDVMLLDIEMPRMDGYELATHMRNDPRLRNVPIIMITSRTGEKHRQRAFEIGVDRYLGKPYQEPELMRNVKEILEVGRGGGD